VIGRDSFEEKKYHQILSNFLFKFLLTGNDCFIFSKTATRRFQKVDNFDKLESKPINF
jgi:hypothetical protein